MDTKELVGTDYGRREGGVEGNANSFEWGLDNYLHSAGSNVTLLAPLEGRGVRSASDAVAR